VESDSTRYTLDVELVDHDGSPWRLSDLLGTPVLLILHRHLH